MITAVFDTNIYISAIGFDANPEKLIRLAHHKAFLLYISPEIKAELTSTLTRKFHHSPAQIKDSLLMVDLTTEIVFPHKHLNVVKSDPTDNKILECCLECKANYLVTGDTKHILPLKQFRNTKIVSVSEFLAILEL
ncbi:MAG: putative toxin-antitoxin system toxin component, PIN family [bacterium]